MDEGISGSEANSALGALGQKMMAQREQYWEECDAAQKLERLRDAVSRMCGEIAALTKAAQRFSVHQHSASGLPVVPLYNDGGDRTVPAAYPHGSGVPFNLRTQRERR